MRKRLIYRCDDVGYTKCYDEGIFKVLNSGIGCSADVMFDAEDAKEALQKLRNMPWISVGWHRHLWEKPVLDPKDVPSLVDERGRFKWGHRRNDLKREATYEDAYKEFEAEVNLCYEYLGRYPDIASISREDIPLEKAFRDIIEKYGIVKDYFLANHQRMRKIGEDLDSYNRSITMNAATCDPKWQDRHIISCPIATAGSYDLKVFDKYNPMIPMTDLVWTEREEIYFYGWHPGYVDDHILKESTSTLHRIKENICALSKEYHDWIVENEIELINFKDALYGTNEFQNHLKDIGSDLYVKDRHNH